MKRIESYAEPPFTYLGVSRDKIVKFHGDHRDRLHQAVLNGEPYEMLLPDTDLKYANLQKSHSATLSTGTQLKSRTVSVDQILDLFRTKILKSESRILTHFEKNTAGYVEFFPNGRTGYNNVTKGNIDTLFDQAILAFSNHKDVLGEELLLEFTALKALYDEARKQQQQQKENKGDSGSSWAEDLEAMNDQAFSNLLTIANTHRGHPEMMRKYFDQSIITRHGHSSSDSNSGAYVLSVPAKTTRAADIIFVAGDKLLVSNTGVVPVYWFGAATADAVMPPNATELPAGDEVEISATVLGYPANRFLLFSNKDQTIGAEVEIVLL